MKWNVLNREGKEVSSVDLNDELFSAESNDSLLHNVIKAYRANKRQGTHATKTRSLVSGGGKKPFKQKGTGNARQGTSRSPLMPGGATAHGPQPRSYTLKTNKKVRKEALRGAISDKFGSKAVYVLEDLNCDSYKTKEVLSLLSSLGVSGQKALLVNHSHSDFLLKSARNIKGVSVSTPDLLNAMDILASSALVMSKESLSLLEKRLES